MTHLSHDELNKRIIEATKLVMIGTIYKRAILES